MRGGGIAEWAFGIAKELPNLGYKTSVYARHRKDLDLETHRDENFEIYLHLSFSRERSSYFCVSVS